MNYFISDTHFNHKKILDFERSRFKTIEEHDDFIMSLIEDRCKKDDVLYHLGDFAFGISYAKEHPEAPLNNIFDRFRKLKCKKVIVLGNHDKYNDIESLNIFDEIHRVPIFLTNRILLSHEPEMCSPYVLNIHGHLHNSILNSENYLNVNVHITNYMLYSQKAIDKLLGHLSERNENFLAEWYRDLYKFTTEADDRVIKSDGTLDVEATIELLKNKFYECELEDGTKVELKKTAKNGNETLYKDRQNNFYLGRWDSVDRKIYINPIKVTELESRSAISKRWERCWVNGKTIAKMFPKASDKEKFAYYHIEV